MATCNRRSDFDAIPGADIDVSIETILPEKTGCGAWSVFTLKLEVILLKVVGC